MTDSPNTPDWIAADTSHTPPRAWAMKATRALGTSENKPNDLRQKFPGAPLLQSTDPEAPQVKLPCKPLDLPAQALGGNRFTLPALAASDQPPITSLLAPARGFLSLNPGWDGVLCVTGPRSHWAHISAEEIVSVQSFLTGDLLTALRATPALSHLDDTPQDDAAFLDAVGETMSRPERLAARLATATSTNQLAGLLIGAELAAARPYWLGQQVAVIGQSPLADFQTKALEAQGVPVTRTDEPTMIRAGLTTARAELQTN